MIQGKIRKSYSLLNKENILNRVTEADIIIAFWPTHVRLEWNKAILSPFRSEGHPSFIIGNKYGCITYKDMADYTYRGDVWSFVQQMEHLADFNSVLLAVDRRFNLGLADGQPIKDKSPVITWQQPKLKIKPPPLIQVITRKWRKAELAWWNQYHIDIKDLKEEYIYVPKEIYRNRKKLILLDSDLVFCYWYPEIEKWKIYRPLKNKKGKNLPPSEWKWDTNIPFGYTEHLKKINQADIAYISKSRKDRMVLKKALGTSAICTTSAEDPACLTEDAIIHLKSNAHRIITISDNDQKGKQFSWYLTEEHGFLHCNVPDDLREKHGWTDFADWAKGAGTLDVVTKHFTEKGFITSLKNAG